MKTTKKSNSKAKSKDAKPKSRKAESKVKETKVKSRKPKPKDKNTKVKETKQGQGKITTEVEEIKTNDKKKISKHRIILTIVFIWALVGAIIRLPPAIPVVIIVYIILIKFPVTTKEIKEFFEKLRKMIGKGGIWGEELGKTGAHLTYHGLVIAATTVREFDSLVGGEEGYNRIINTLGKVTERIGRHVVNVGITAGKVVIALTKYTMKRIEEEKKNLPTNERKLLSDESVKYKIVNEDKFERLKNEYVNFVNTRDD